MLGQKAYLVGMSVNTIRNDRLNGAMRKAGLLTTWEQHKQKINGDEYIVLGMYTKTLNKKEASQVKGIVYRLRDEGRINPISIKGTKRSNILSILNPSSSSHVGYPITLLNQKDFLCVMCMLNVEKVGDILGNSNKSATYKPSNRFECLLSK